MPASDYQYWLGKEKEDLKAISVRGIHRRDADDKTTGKGVYGRDVKLPGMLYARVMMCPHAHAKIKSLDTSAAEALPGVRAVLRYDDPMVPPRIIHGWDPDVAPHIFSPNYTMPTYTLGHEAFYEGAPLGVAIAADDLDIADEAMDLVKVEWEVKDFVIDVEKALEPGAPHVYDYMTSFDPNALVKYRYASSITPETETIEIAPGWEGKENANNIKKDLTFTLAGTDLEAGFAAADDTIEFSFRKAEVWGFSPEILSTVCRWTDDGMLEFWQGGEAVPTLAIYSLMVGIPEDKFIPHAPYAGGQFGGWDFSSLFPQACQIPVGAFLSKKTGMPVKVVFQRKDEQFAEMDEGIHNIKVGYKNDGTITAIQIDAKVAQIHDMGMLPDTTGGGHFIESTSIPNVKGRSICAFLNKHGFGAYRCEQQINAQIKQQVFTRVAAAVGVDEGTIALINNGQEGHDMAYVSEFKQNNRVPDIDSLGIVLDTAKNAVNFDQKFHAPGEGMLPNGKLHGMCLCPNHEFSNGASPYPPEYAVWFLHLSVDGGKIFMTGHRPDCGVDGRTGFCRIIADTMGMKLEDVLYSRPQEALHSQPSTFLNGGGGSVTFTSISWVVVATARVLKNKILAKAAAMLGTTSEELDIVDSHIIFKADPSNSTPIEALPLTGMTAISRENTSEMYYGGYLNMPFPPSPASLFISRCVNIVEVEVDPETGGVEIVNAVAANDVGLSIGPETTEGQMYGGAIMGYSTSGIEEVVYDPPTGTRLNPNFIDYKILTMADLSEVECHMIESRMGYGPYGSCGIGEDNCTFCSAMMPAAVYNATGVWVDYPTTPERVLKALGKA